MTSSTSVLLVNYTGIDGWALRGGYILTNNVVPESYAAPTFSTPAPAHTVTLGAGTSILNDKLDIDFAAEYNHVNAENVRSTNPTTNDGRYSSSAYAFHISTRYKF